MSSSAETLLSRLDKVRQRSADQWSARCPAHDDNGPSLSIRELPDGQILLRCFAGCDVGQIVVAVGLELSDLFPSRPSPGGGAGPLKRRRLLSAGQALRLLVDEANLVAVAASNMAHGVALSNDELAGVLQAAARIAYLRDEVAS